MGVKIVLATHNPGKVAEARAICRGYGFEVVSAGEMGIEPVAEDGSSYEQNAYAKAASVAGAGVIAVGEDSGLEVSALDGRPGVLSARYGGDISSAEQCQLILSELAGCKDRSARFVAVCVIIFADGTKEVVLGECRGRICEGMKGEGGFGYDPIFVPDGYEKTMAELGDEKNQISHRRRAWDEVLRVIDEAVRGNG